jgi:Transposase IS116/IS110/IS902 family
MTEEYAGRQVVGVDLHRHRSVLVRMTEDGRKLGTARISNSAAALRAEIARAGENPRVVLEATYGWYWAADTLAAAGPRCIWRIRWELRPTATGGSRTTCGTRRTCCGWGGCRRRGSRPRRSATFGELTRYRQKLIGLLTSCKDQVHAVLAKLGIAVSCSDLFGAFGSAWLDGLRLPQPYGGKVTSLRQLIGELNTEIAMLTEVIGDLLAGDPGYRVIQQLPGIGPVLAAVIIAEIGDVTRFRTAAQLASWAGLTPGHRESDLKVTRGHVTKQGSRLLQWALIEAIQRAPAGFPARDAKDAIIARRGAGACNIAKVAAARRLLTLVYYGLRDGQIRCLPAPARAA